MPAIFRIHPAIGIARVGNSPNSFYIAPEVTGGLPIDCDPEGNPIVKDDREQPVSKFKDAQGRIRRQAARFRVYLYDDANAYGRELKIGDVTDIVDKKSGQRRQVRIDDIRWTVYLANKKDRRRTWLCHRSSAAQCRHHRHRGAAEAYHRSRSAHRAVPEREAAHRCVCTDNRRRSRDIPAEPDTELGHHLGRTALPTDGQHQPSAGPGLTHPLISVGHKRIRQL